MFTEAAMHTPMDVTKKALAVATEKKVDCVVSDVIEKLAQSLADAKELLLLKGRCRRRIYDRLGKSYRPSL
jgi:hypothetical protein